MHPGADDICGDGIDQDCNGSDLVCDIPVEPVDPNTIDNDGDGYSENQGDCNDSNAAIHPGADDICGDGIDQDCNGSDLVCDIPVAVGLASSHYGTYRVTSIQADTNGSQDCLFVGDEATITDNQSLHDMDNYVWIPRNIATYSNTYIDSDGDTVTQTETISANMLIMDEIGTWGDEPDKGWNVHLEIDFENLTFTLTETDSEIYDGCEGTYRGTLVKID
ncbi:MAG: putative metal-binding motif-containing protein [Deltaproteobacteria bacterium]|nr:putative metal-binding motif-containing protein [Deltaproteobacteria bacterium]